MKPGWKLRCVTFRLAPASGTRLNTACSPPSPQNWRGKPLISHEVVVNLIGATTTETGLRVTSKLDTNRYPAGRQVSDDELAVIHLRRDAFHADWNYSLLPRPTPALDIN